LPVKKMNVLGSLEQLLAGQQLFVVRAM